MHVTGNCTAGTHAFVSLHVAMANDNVIGYEGYSEAGVCALVVEDGAAIGAGAIVAAGVAMSKGAAVGAGLVIIGTVSLMTKVVGMPTRMIHLCGSE